MARRSNPARLVLALSVAAVLAVFLVYVSLGWTEKVVLSGKVVGPVAAQSESLHRFRLRDVQGTATVVVTYPGTLPDQFKRGRDISLQGRLQGGVFRGVAGTMITKCPSKYAPKQN